MRKHFLILMLLTLLPFTAWADIVVTPGVYSKTYGDGDPAVSQKHILNSKTLEWVLMKCRKKVTIDNNNTKQI